MLRILGHCKWKGLWQITATCVLLGFVPLIVAGAESDMQTTVRKYQQHFLEMNKNNTGSSAVGLNAFLSTVTNESPASAWCAALSAIVEDAKHQPITSRSTIFVEDLPTVEVLVAALTERDNDIRSFAIRTLTWEVKRPDLAKFVTKIHEGLGENPQISDDILLFARLPMTDVQKRNTLSKTNLPAVVRARLGELEAEQQLIAEFEKERDYYKKSSLARSLGYIGSRRCAQALVKGLRSEVFVDAMYEQRSIRCSVLLSLGLIYEGEALFTVDARSLDSNSEEVFDQQRNLSHYIQDVDSWVKENFGYSAWGANKVWFKRSKNIPIVEPGVPVPKHK